MYDFERFLKDFFFNFEKKLTFFSNGAGGGGGLPPAPEQKRPLRMHFFLRVPLKYELFLSLT